MSGFSYVGSRVHAISLQTHLASRLLLFVRRLLVTLTGKGDRRWCWYACSRLSQSPCHAAWLDRLRRLPLPTRIFARQSTLLFATRSDLPIPRHSRAISTAYRRSSNSTRCTLKHTAT